MIIYFRVPFYNIYFSYFGKFLHTAESVKQEYFSQSKLIVSKMFTLYYYFSLNYQVTFLQIHKLYHNIYSLRCIIVVLSLICLFSTNLFSLNRIKNDHR